MINIYKALYADIFVDTPMSFCSNRRLTPVSVNSSYGHIEFSKHIQDIIHTCIYHNLTHFIPTTTVVVVTLSIPTTTFVVVAHCIPTTTKVVVENDLSNMFAVNRPRARNPREAATHAQLTGCVIRACVQLPLTKFCAV